MRLDADQHALLWAASDGGVLRARNLLDLGVPPRTISHRCLVGGPWRRLLPGIVGLFPGRPTRRQQVTASLMYAGRDALLTGPDALRIHGLDVGLGAQVHILVPAGTRRLSTLDVLIERTTRLPAPVPSGGRDVAPAVRAVLDTARRYRRPDDVRAVLTAAVQRSLTTPAELVVELDAGSSHGSALARRILREEIVFDVHSVAEADALRIARASGLPQPLWNVDVLDAAGRFLARPDAWFDEVAMAWEIQSKRYHLSVADQDRTFASANALISHGVALVQSRPTQLRLNRTDVIATLIRTHEHAARRPRPDVTYRARAA